MGLKYLLIPLLVSGSLCGQFWDYTTGTTMTCSKITEYNDAMFWQAIRHHNLDKYFILVMAPIEVVLLFLVILSYRIKNSKSQPSDILIALAVCQLFSIGAALSMAVYEEINIDSLNPPNFMNFCNTITVFGVIGWIGISIYTILFCIILSYTVRNALKGGLFSKRKYHVISIILIITATFGVYFSNQIDNQQTICMVKYSTISPYLRSFASACLILIALISIYRFKNGIPKNSFFQQQSIYKYYYIYIFFVVSLQIMSQISGLFGIYNCNQDVPDPALGISYSIQNILQLLNPILLVLLRFSHPAVTQKIKQIFRAKKKTSLQLVVSLSEEEESSEVKYNWLGSLLESIRGSQVYSILVGMLLSHIDFKNDTIRSIKDVDFTCRYVYEINQFTADRYIDKTFGARESKRIKNGIGGLKPLDFQVTCYCPRVFKYFLQKSGLNIQVSLSLVANGEVIKQQAHMAGGQASQFMFSSHDNQIILKTITKSEAQLYQQKIGEFVNHYRRQQNSLISPIIGLYKFKRLDTKDQNIYIILQKNIAMCDKKYTKRVYDLKGVSQERRSLDRRTADFRDITYLDRDFMAEEKKIDISPIGASHIKRILIDDINFLKSLEVIDYSLLIIKIDWDKISIDTRKTIDIVTANNINPFKIMPSETQKGVFYHFALIDYLHTWTLGKQTQKFFKKVFRKEDSSHEIRANSIESDEPNTYGHRLLKLVQNIF